MREFNFDNSDPVILDAISHATATFPTRRLAFTLQNTAPLGCLFRGII